MRLLQATLVLLVALTTSAHANYEKALAAVERNDSAGAFREFRAAAEAGDERAFIQVARAYAVGVGTPVDLGAARRWAEKAATKGAPDAQFLVYAVIVSMPELNYFDSKGQFDAKRYAALAARPISQREDEMVAYDMLGKAAAQGYPDALLRLAGFYADNVGEGNRKRAAELLDKLPKRPPVFDGLRKALAELDAIGPTLMTVRIADQAIPAASRAAQAAAAEKDKSKAECKAVKPARAQRMGPINKPIWLPLAVDGLKTAYLMSGDWRERWTFDVCGAETAVHVMFVADGLGGARSTVEKER
jgi:TPR repeat protein